MSYSNYRNNMPHYDSMPNNYNPRGIYDYEIQNMRKPLVNTMPAMLGMEDLLRPFIPDTEIPFEIDGDMPALPRTPVTQMPQPGMPQQPQMPDMPGMPQHPQMPGMPQQPQMPMPGMPQQPQMPGMPQMPMPGMPQMPMPGMPQQPQMPGMMPDGNMYPMMPGMPNGMPPLNCEQLMEMMRRMNCPMNGNGTNMPRPIVPPENGTVSQPDDQDM